jgi:hypothetical protein
VARSATRPPHTLTQEVVPTRADVATALGNLQETDFRPSDAEKPMTADERDRLLAMTATGRAALAARGVTSA